MIAFFEWDGVDSAAPKVHGAPVKGPFIFDHVSFGVENSQDLWELKDKLEAAGFPCTDVKDHGFIHSVYAHDPNGIPIEFSWPVDGVNIHQTPILADSLPSEIAKEGAEPLLTRWPKVAKPTEENQKKIIKAAGSELYLCLKKRNSKRLDPSKIYSCSARPISLRGLCQERHQSDTETANLLKGVGRSY